jgi:hypothetical protein
MHNPTLCAILARNSGNRYAAAMYCALMVLDYPRLAVEYKAYEWEFLNETAKDENL